MCIDWRRHAAASLIQSNSHALSPTRRGVATPLPSVRNKYTRSPLRSCVNRRRAPLSVCERAKPSEYLMMRAARARLTPPNHWHTRPPTQTQPDRQRIQRTIELNNVQKTTTTTIRVTHKLLGFTEHRTQTRSWCGRHTRLTVSSWPRIFRPHLAHALCGCSARSVAPLRPRKIYAFHLT